MKTLITERRSGTEAVTRATKTRTRNNELHQIPKAKALKKPFKVYLKKNTKSLRNVCKKEIVKRDSPRQYMINK